MSKKPGCPCVADETQTGPLVQSFRGPRNRKRWKTSRQVFHHRRSDDAYFWHWADQRMVLAKIREVKT